MADTPTEQLGREIEAFKKDIRQLQQDLSEMLKATGSTGKDKLEEGQRRLKEAMNAVKGQVKEKAAHAYETVKGRSCQALEKGRTTVGQKPLTSIVVAFVAGAILGVFSNRNR